MKFFKKRNNMHGEKTKASERLVIVSTWSSRIRRLVMPDRAVLTLRMVGIGRTLLFVSALLYCLHPVLTCVASRASAPAMPAFAAALSESEEYRPCSPSLSPGDRLAGYPSGTSRKPRRGEAYSC